MIEYKGYVIEPRYSKEDECFIGVVEGLQKDSISAEGNNLAELEKDFQNAIENYLQYCRRVNREPERQR